MFEGRDSDLEEAARLLEALDDLPDTCRLRLAPYFKHGGEDLESPHVFDAGLLAADLRTALEQARALQSIVSVGRAIWRDE